MRITTDSRRSTAINLTKQADFTDSSHSTHHEHQLQTLNGGRFQTLTISHACNPIQSLASCAQPSSDPFSSAITDLLFRRHLSSCFCCRFVSSDTCNRSLTVPFSISNSNGPDAVPNSHHRGLNAFQPTKPVLFVFVDHPAFKTGRTFKSRFYSADSGANASLITGVVSFPFLFHFA